MKTEEQVLSIEQMQHLKDLGVEVKDTAMCIVKVPYLSNRGWEEFYKVVLSDEKNELAIPTLTLQEVLKLLPDEIRHEGNRFFPYMDIGSEFVLYSDMIDFADRDANRKIHHECDSDTLLDEAYNMLCWVAENGYLNKK